MNNKLALLFFILLFFSCTEKNNETEDPEQNAVPELVSTIPVTNAIIPVLTEKIDFIFDRKIIIVDRGKMKLNNQAVSAATVSENTLTIQLGRLEEQTAYTLILEKNAVKAQPGKMNPEPFSIAFTTEKMPVVEISPLVVENPSTQAVNLYNFLKENYGKKIISGAMANVNWNIEEAQWVYATTGKYPALNGFDYIHLHYSPADWIDYSKTQVVENWWNNNGIVTAMWHWNVPRSPGSNEYAFYTNETSFDISKATQAGTYENGIIKADLEKTANYLLLLKQKNIPVLWRPLHEAAGGWFWWGAKGAQPCKELWKMMFNYFQEKELNNLIWVWTSEPNDDAWYPGDEYVDIIGRDLYDKPAASDVYNEYNRLKNKYPDKIITLSECGNVAAVSDQWNANATWSWFMPWYDPTNHSYANAAFWKNAFANDKVITRDQIPSLK